MTIDISSGNDLLESLLRDELDPRASDCGTPDDIQRAWSLCEDALLLARLSSRFGDSTECTLAAAALALWALRFMRAGEFLQHTADDRVRLAAAAVEAWMRGEGTIGASCEAMQTNGDDGGDWATRQALSAIHYALLRITDNVTGRADEDAISTLIDTCEDVLEAAGLRDWDEMLAEAAVCEAAPWPNSDYEAMQARREAIVRDANISLSDILRTHTSTTLNRLVDMATSRAAGVSRQGGKLR